MQDADQCASLEFFKEWEEVSILFFDLYRAMGSGLDCNLGITRSFH